MTADTPKISAQLDHQSIVESGDIFVWVGVIVGVLVSSCLFGLAGFMIWTLKRPSSIPDKSASPP
jgi:hypothetical protein